MVIFSAPPSQPRLASAAVRRSCGWTRPPGPSRSPSHRPARLLSHANLALSPMQAITTAFQPLAGTDAESLSIRSIRPARCITGSPLLSSKPAGKSRQSDRESPGVAWPFRLHHLPQRKTSSRNVGLISSLIRKRGLKRISRRRKHSRKGKLQVCPRCGCLVEIDRHTLPRCQRYQRIIRLRTSTMSLREIGHKFGISGERVRQILRKKGANPAECRSAR